MYVAHMQPGNITILMQSTPLVDIDFICWGPFAKGSVLQAKGSSLKVIATGVLILIIIYLVRAGL